MKPEAQNVAIAEARGWQFANPHSPEMKETAIMCWVRPGNSFWQTEKLPDHLNDLNAMHEAEKTLTDDQLIDYAEWLGVCFDEHPSKACVVLLRATAAQRAEAFLRTIGKWEE
jgi:hypothetical protein